MYIVLKVIQFIGAVMIWRKFFSFAKPLPWSQWIPTFLIALIGISFFYFAPTDAIIKLITE